VWERVTPRACQSQQRPSSADAILSALEAVWEAPLGSHGEVQIQEAPPPRLTLEASVRDVSPLHKQEKPSKFQQYFKTQGQIQSILPNTTNATNTEGTLDFITSQV